MRRRLLIGGIAAYLAATVALTFIPRDLQQQARRAAAAIGLISGPTSMAHAAWQAGMAERMINGFMLVPLAALVVIASGPRRAWLVVVGSAALSGVIEVSQHLTGLGRAGETSDFLFNVAGAGVGAVVAGLLVQRRTTT